MRHRRSRYLVFPLLALSMSLAIAATAQAQQRSYNSGTSVSGTLRINLGGSPRWTSINGSRVEEIAEGQRPDYDMFRFNGGYYAYNNERWYTSRTDRGDFILIDDANVPSELISVPRDHWRNYPSRWAANDRRDYSSPSRTSASFRVNFGSSPRWSGISGTRVEEISDANRPDYDMFRFNGSYYAYNNDRWYSSTNDRGDFAYIDDGDVPRELISVPRDHWRNYPSRWNDSNYGRDYSNNRRDYSNQAPMRTSTSLQINFGNNPRWSSIRGTRIQEIRGRERPDYDMFRYGRVYYVYSNDQWYSSNRGRGNFIAIDDRDVPWELSRIPRDRWHSYPSAWMDRQRDPRNHRGNGRYR